MVIRQYPYQLWAELTQEATQNANGHFVAGSSGWVEVDRCRDEANSKGGTVNLEDGTAYTYESLIQLPRSATQIQPGTPVEVRDGEVVRLAGTVQRSVNGQLHNRLWV